MKFKSIDEKERMKYNFIHNSENFGEDVYTKYPRQLNELKTYNQNFHKLWRECIENKMSFLDIGVGGGACLKYFQSENIDYCGIDISDDRISFHAKNGLNVKTSSCHNMSIFEDNSFNVVQHLDGMEHIPVQWELKALSEAIRVSKKYVFHANAMCDAHNDSISKSAGYDDVHINVKNKDEWDIFYNSNSKKLDYRIILAEVIHNTYYTVLEKN